VDGVNVTHVYGIMEIKEEWNMQDEFFDEEQNEHIKKMKQAKILMILGVLLKYSDEEHPIESQAEIGRLVEQEYGVKIYDRKTNTKVIRNNLMILRDFLEKAEFGYTLEYVYDKEKMVAHTFKDEETELLEGTSLHGWYIQRDISNAELIPLIDSLLFSKYIPYSECKELVNKLEALASKHFKRDIKLPNNKSTNKQLFYIIEILSEAISKGKRVSFQFLEYNTDIEGKMQVVLGKDGNPHIYKVSPYEIVITNGRYYLICSNSKGDNLFHYRIDFIRDMKFLKIDENGADEDSNYVKNRPIKEMKGHERGLNLAKYMREHIYMYTGDSVPVEMIADKEANPGIVGNIRDWFGDGVLFSNEDKQYITARVTVNKRAMLYWALQFGQCVEIIKPQELRDDVAKAVKGMYSKYIK